MASAQVARTTVGLMGNVISFFLFASPIPTFVGIYKRKSVGEFKADPYLASVINCMLWVLYGLPMVHPGGTFIVTNNCIGLLMELFYLALFLIYANPKLRLKVIGWLVVEFAFVGVVAACTILLRHTHAQRSSLVGIICVIFVCLMYAAPLTILKKVMTTKSVEYMPFYLSLAAFSNAVVWVAFALIKFDLFILVGNVIGGVFGGLQLILYACYYSSTPKVHADNIKPSEQQLSSSNNNTTINIGQPPRVAV